MRQISTSKGCRSLRSVENGCLPNASETCLPAPTNFPFGEDQDNSVKSFVFTLCMIASSPVAYTPELTHFLARASTLSETPHDSEICELFFAAERILAENEGSH